VVGVLVLMQRRFLKIYLAWLSIVCIPAVVSGWGKILDDFLEEKGISTSFVDGQRVTCDRTLSTILDDVIPYIENLFESPYIEFLYAADIAVVEPVIGKGHVANVHSVNIDLVETLIAEEKIPYIFPIGELRGQLYNINADDLAYAVAKEMQPHKFIAITGTGGVLDVEGNLISKLCLADVHSLISSGIVNGGMAKKLHLDELFACSGEDFCVQIVGPDELLLELESDVGYGTMVVR
jgi:acetylglutamate kinase